MAQHRQSDRGQGRYAGRGPKGYRRDDNRIREDVSEELTQHGDIDASEITVEVRNGEVILTGTVPDRQSKRLAEDIAERSSGVREVQNQLRVGSVSEESSSRAGAGGMSGSESGREQSARTGTKSGTTST
jgi:osmotically-inducible protein OsmY